MKTSVPETPARLALVDIGLPGMSGIQGIRRTRQRRPEISPVILTVYAGGERIMQALESASGGSRSEVVAQALLRGLVR